MTATHGLSPKPDTSMSVTMAMLNSFYPEIQQQTQSGMRKEYTNPVYKAQEGRPFYTCPSHLSVTVTETVVLCPPCLVGY